LQVCRAFGNHYPSPLFSGTIEATKKSKQFARIKAEEQINSFHKVLAAQNNANKTKAKRNETEHFSLPTYANRTKATHTRRPHTRTNTGKHPHTQMHTHTHAQGAL